MPAVARTVRDTILRSERFELRLVSLAMSAQDPAHLAIRAPHRWPEGAKALSGSWEGWPYVHVGAVFGELEFQRYRPRRVLTGAIAECSVLHVVCGSPAWANTVCGLGKLVSLQVASLARVERRRREKESNDVAGWWRKAMTSITSRLDDRALRSVDAIQVMNPWMLDHARAVNAGRAVDIRYAPPGIDAELFHPLSTREPLVKPYILCVGRLDDPRKNVGLLLEAFALLLKIIKSNVRLVLAGHAGPSDIFWKRANALGVRNQIDSVVRPDLAKLVALYQCATAFVLPSDEEGFGVVLLESMACGVPVVSTKSGGPDGIVTDGQDGYLVGCDDAPGMAARLLPLLRDSALNIRMGANARATIERRFTERLSGDVLIDVWNRLLDKAEIA